MLGYEDIMTIDPGDSTGICRASKGVYKTRTVPHGDIYAYLKKLGDGAYPSLFVVESFVSRPTNYWRTQHAAQIIGAVKMFSSIIGVPVLEQLPAQAKLVPMSRVSASWEYSTQHEADAIRHLIYYLSNKH